MIDTLFVLCFCTYFFYKYYKNKETKQLFVGLILGFLQLHYWPLYLPIFVSFGLQALFAGGLVFYEYYVKKKDRLAVTFCILFVGFGLVFLAQAIPRGNPTVNGIISKVMQLPQ